MKRNTNALSRAYCLITILFVSFSTWASLPSAESLKKLVKEAVRQSKTPGAVLLMSQPDTSILMVSAGFADKKTHTPMKTFNNFRIASMSKTFLAVTVLKLIEEGQFKLEDKIAPLLPKSVAIERLPNGRKVTVKQLLQMRSGIPNYVEYDAYYDLIDSKQNETWRPEECIAVIYDEKPNFSPDKSYEYSNTNYLLLQLIIEKTTGLPYDQVIAQKILIPLHLQNTYVETGHKKNQIPFTHGYDLENKKVIDVTRLNDGWGMGDGGMVSTVNDIQQFINALLNEKSLLTPTSLSLMLSTKDDYGLGIYREKVGGMWAWTHNGTSSGFAGQYYYFPQNQLSVILLTNYFDTDIIDDLAANAVELIDD